MGYPLSLLYPHSGSSICVCWMETSVFVCTPCRGQRLLSGASSMTIPWFWRQGLSENLELTDLPTPVVTSCELQAPLCLCFPKHKDYRCVLLCAYFLRCVLGIPIQTLMLHTRPFTLRAMSQAIGSSFSPGKANVFLHS